MKTTIVSVPNAVCTIRKRRHSGSVRAARVAVKFGNAQILIDKQLDINHSKYLILIAYCGSDEIEHKGLRYGHLVWYRRYTRSRQ